MPRHNYTKELLEPLVKSSKSWAEVCRKLNVKPATGAQTHITTVSKKFGIDHSHFSGRAWNKGKSFPPKRKIEVYLTKGYKISSHVLKLRLIKEGIKKAECEKCKLTHWQDEPTVLELHHINSDHFDNRLENLQILCPNCHALLTRNRRKKPTVLKIRKDRIKGDPNWRTSPKFNQRKVTRPEKEELINLIKTNSFVKLGKQFGVSDNAVRKWCKTYQINLARVV